MLGIDKVPVKNVTSWESSTDDATEGENVSQTTMEIYKRLVFEKDDEKYKMVHEKPDITDDVK